MVWKANDVWVQNLTACNFLAGTGYDTIMDNRFVRNGAWGVIFVPYPDTETPPSDAPACKGGISGPDNVCDYDNWGNALIGNAFTGNGFYGAKHALSASRQRAADAGAAAQPEDDAEPVQGRSPQSLVPGQT